jgi:hypothetical protein
VIRQPTFPLRIIFDDGECVEIESPEELMEKVDTLDSGDPKVWVRDALDRSVRLQMRGGIVEALETMG